MKKILHFLSENILFIVTLFFLAFIPLYPKLPLIDVKNTWVYIRIEDFLVAVTFVIFFIQWVRKKAAVNSALTLPILIYWVVGAISTLFAVVFIFPHLANTSLNLAFLFYLRHIEYLSLFFVAYAAMKQKKFVPYVVGVLTITMIIVVLYGFGQKGFLVGWDHRFPAFSTMNEEFAKGTPLLLSALGRISSTFAGHYDLAAYLVLLIPIMGSLIFGVKKWWLKLLFLVTAFGGLLSLLMTASRVSFGMYLLAVSFMLILQKKKWLIIPVIIISIFTAQYFEGIKDRFASTFSQVDTVVDANTGKVIGIAKGGEKDIVIEDIQQTGENLPQGSGFINIPGKQTGQDVSKVTKKSLSKAGGNSTEITNLEGDYVVKKSLAYDISFTTRFQGEWPRAIRAFSRNYLLGSGYSSLNLASDNNYLRILGETGFLGISSFFFIFLILSIATYRITPQISSPLAKSLVLGIITGLFGLALNATLIDVFEASKIAFVMWALIGVAMGILHLYQEKKVHYLEDLKTILTSIPAVIIFFLLAGISLFANSLNNFFVADDFTWLRWVADCTQRISGTCQSLPVTVRDFFLHSENFFYRPGVKLYFYFMYAISWFSPFLYHVVSVLLHIAATILVYLITQRIGKNKLVAFITACLFLTLSVHSEIIFWISSIGHLVSSVCILAGIYFFLLWKDTKRWYLLLPSLLSVIAAPYFQEFGIIAPFVIIAVDLVIYGAKQLTQLVNRWYYVLFLLPTPLYLWMKLISHSWWSAGDYSYNIVKLPFNVIGNVLGYIVLTLIGSRSLGTYELIRQLGRGDIPFSHFFSTFVTNPWMILYIIFLVAVLVFTSYLLYQKRNNQQFMQRSGVSLVLWLLPLFPFLALGNISVRYTYLSSFGLILFVVFLFQELYEWVPKTQKKVVVTLLILGSVLICGLNIVELNRINSDWRQAGQITNTLLADMSNNFTSSKKRILPKNPVFYFINVPSKYGEAWIFPVGLEDALWFTFQNEPLQIRRASSADEAIHIIENMPNALIFEFGENGVVDQIIPPPKPTPKPKGIHAQ